MELKFEVFVILVLLLVSIILVSLESIKPDMASLIIYLLATFLLISFFVLFLISKNKKEHLSKKPLPSKNNMVVSNPYSNNLYPTDLIPLANDEFNKCKPELTPRIPDCKKDECVNVNDKCNNYNVYPTVTPNLPKNTITKGQCAICQISPEQSIEY